MTERQKSILGVVVREYTETAKPVGSKVLVSRYGFDLSPATIRNEMKALEDARMIHQPHTSAGRIPTAKGYRFFVDALMQHVDLAKQEQDKLEQKLKTIRQGHDKVLQEAAGMLAQVSGNIALTEKEEEQAFCTGISNLLHMPEFSNVEKACRMAEIFERLSEEVSKLDSKSKSDQEVAVYIGDESEVTEDLDCSLLVSKYQLPSGEKGHIAILGPTRMKYSRNISLLKYMTKLLRGGLFVLPIVITINIVDWI